MAEATLTCPGCRKSFTLKATDLDALRSKVFKCPKCGRQTPFSQLLGQGAGNARDLHTHIAGNPASGAGLHTQIGGVPLGAPSGNKTQVAAGARNGVVSLVFEQPQGKVITLQPGTHTLGRDSSDSRASVRLAPDPYMSRLHAQLEIIPSIQGTIIRIIPLNPQNPVIVNGRRVDNSLGAALRNGDTLTLGYTKIMIRI